MIVMSGQISRELVKLGLRDAAGYALDLPPNRF
jgi:hypothetical protein